MVVVSVVMSVVDMSCSLSAGAGALPRDVTPP